MKSIDSGKAAACYTINHLLSGASVERLGVKLERNRLTSSTIHEHLWSVETKEVLELLESENIEYVLIKAFDVPHVHMEDIDLLIENHDHARKTLSILHKQGFKLFRDRYSLNPLKTTALSSPHGLQVDIYPEAVWFNMRYAPKFFITSNRIRRTIKGVEAYTATPTLDAYIVITHAYNHGFLSLAETAHIVKLVKENDLDLNIIRYLGNAFQLNHAVTLFLNISLLSCSPIKNYSDIHQLLHSLLVKDRLSRIYQHSFNKSIIGDFPIIIPLHLRGLSASSRIFRPNLKNNTFVYDEFAGYLLALLFRGERRVFLS